MPRPSGHGAGTKGAAGVPLGAARGAQERVLPAGRRQSLLKPQLVSRAHGQLLRHCVPFSGPALPLPTSSALGCSPVLATGVADDLREVCH